MLYGGGTIVNDGTIHAENGEMIRQCRVWFPLPPRRAAAFDNRYSRFLAKPVPEGPFVWWSQQGR